MLHGRFPQLAENCSGLPCRARGRRYWANSGHPTVMFFRSGLVFLAGLLCILWSPLGVAEDLSSPREFWWYWDRPAEQLPAPAPGIGAAVVVTHVIFSGERFARQRRRSALRLPEGVVTMPVVHVEVDPALPFAGNMAQIDGLREAVLDVVRRGASHWVQLDFEARRSQREFWLAAVQQIKTALPSGVRLSVTALASWCYEDRWLADAPVDEIVPMYFRLKGARHEYIMRSAVGVTEPRCASAYGVADDEPEWPVALSGRRYVFLGRRVRPIVDSQRSPSP